MVVTLGVQEHEVPDFEHGVDEGLASPNWPPGWVTAEGLGAADGWFALGAGAPEVWTMLETAGRGTLLDATAFDDAGAGAWLYPAEETAGAGVGA